MYRSFQGMPSEKKKIADVCKLIESTNPQLRSLCEFMLENIPTINVVNYPNFSTCKEALAVKLIEIANKALEKLPGEYKELCIQEKTSAVKERAPIVFKELQLFETLESILKGDLVSPPSHNAPGCSR